MLVPVVIRVGLLGKRMFSDLSCRKVNFYSLCGSNFETSIKVKIIPLHPVVLFHRLCSIGIKVPVCKNMYVNMFDAELFLVAKTWVPNKCPLVGEGQIKLWNIFIILYSYLKGWVRAISDERISMRYC